jgi:hypothetical protein
VISILFWPPVVHFINCSSFWSHWVNQCCLTEEKWYWPMWLHSQLYLYNR